MAVPTPVSSTPTAWLALRLWVLRCVLSRRVRPRSVCVPTAPSTLTAPTAARSLAHCVLFLTFCVCACVPLRSLVGCLPLCLKEVTPAAVNWLWALESLCRSRRPGWARTVSHMCVVVARDRRRTELGTTACVCVCVCVCVQTEWCACVQLWGHLPIASKCFGLLYHDKGLNAHV